jgi:NAD(P)-dependent dehydrogenase (short-subunit alcohol dehydrogenase family)
VVTGGASGIGAACVQRLRADHDHVLLLDRSAPAGQEEAGASAGWGSVRYVATDVTEPASLAAAAGMADGLGEVRTLVCAAGVQGYGTVTETDPAEFDRVIGINLRGVFLTCRAMVPVMTSPAAIVVVSSVQAHAAQTGVVAYAASKGGLLAMVRAMAVDLAGAGIRVNAVCPGSVDTPMLRATAAGIAKDGDTDRVVADWGRSHPIGRVARPAEVAEVVAFLADPAASFVTGEDVKVDGGLMAQIPVSLD